MRVRRFVEFPGQSGSAPMRDIGAGAVLLQVGSTIAAGARRCARWLVARAIRSGASIGTDPMGSTFYPAVKMALEGTRDSVPSHLPHTTSKAQAPCLLVFIYNCRFDSE